MENPGEAARKRCRSGEDLMLEKHMETLQAWSGASTELVPWERLPDLLLVEGLTDLQQRQHDLVQIETTKGVRNASKKIPLEKLFLPLSKLSIPPRISVTIGVAGIGKSTLVKLFVHLWAKGEIGKDFTFVLPLTFRELNTYDKLSAERLIRLAAPHLTDPHSLSLGSARVLLVLDGLDEFKTLLDFSNTAVCTDVRKEIQVDSLITNIIRGNLLQTFSLWITSRPTAASQIPGGLVDCMTEVQGFGDEDIKGYLDRMFVENQSLADCVMHHLKLNRSLYIMCTVPAFCRVCASSIGYFLKAADHAPDMSSVPKTLSEIYSYHFKMLLCGDWPGKPKEVLKIEQVVNNCKKMMSCLGRLAFYSLIKRKYMFHEQDVKAYGVDLSSLHLSLSSRLLLKEETSFSTIYHFPHLTFQEFLAAIYYFTSAKRSIFDLFVENGMSWPKLGFLNHFKNAVQRALQSEDGHLDIFVRFLAGLLSPQVNKALADWFLVRDEQHSYQSQAVTLLQGLLGVDQAVSCRTVNLMRCLHEIRCTEVAANVEEAMKSESLSGMLTPANCSALAYLLQTSEVCAEEANLSNCLTHHAFQSLLSQLLYCNNLRLDYNQFKDSAMDLLGSVLSGKDCQIQKISLAENQIGNKGAKALARSLMVNRSLMALDLRSNSIGSQGAKALADALKINQYLLSLNLQNNKIKEDGAKCLANAVAHNHTLRTLNLQKNSVGPQGSKEIADALKKNWNLKELILSSNSVGDAGAAALAEGLRANHTLLLLDLQSNSISDTGITALTQALCSNKGLSTLNLRENSISKEGARQIARALRANSTLRNLDLAANLLHDEGVQAIAMALKENQALESLHLQWNFVQSMAAKALSQALQLNNSLTLLDLQENAIGDEGTAALASALRVNATLTDLYLQAALVGESGARALGEALAINKRLETLDLRGNTIGLSGAKAMASALKVNGTLRKLNLQENALGMDGAICIATALTGSHSLTYINLQGNRIGESGAKVIADAIRTNAPDCVVET
ncbi:NLR family CARD domain-containing protein 3 [Varanus komodoensis]|uniref:NLR family CARD domain-containing protein 3 n=1 Tax=Varanus komodoensis TaxID=61221 RepID=UPI001CF7E6A9|nr:NLR family CARD domain-containing protein 3 [Varanus komodoensis]